MTLSHITGIREEIGTTRSLTERVIRGAPGMDGACGAHGRWESSEKGDVTREVGRRARGRPRLRWKDGVERDFKMAGGDGDWRVRSHVI